MQKRSRKFLVSVLTIALTLGLFSGSFTTVYGASDKAKTAASTTATEKQAADQGQWIVKGKPADSSAYATDKKEAGKPTPPPPKKSGAQTAPQKSGGIEALPAEGSVKAQSSEYDFNFVANDSGGATVTDYYAEDPNVNIPASATIDGSTYPVTEIGEEAFSWTNIQSVTIPDSVRAIQFAAFRNCNSLTDVNLPANLEYIGNSAFSRCQSLYVISIPETVNYIGYFAFGWCPSLAAIIFRGALPTHFGDEDQDVFVDASYGLTVFYPQGDSSWEDISAGYPGVTTFQPYGSSFAIAFFNSNGGASVDAITGISSGSLIPEPAAPERYGYVFTGWYKDRDCTQPWDFGSDTVVAGITFIYAGWEEDTSGTIQWSVNYKNGGIIITGYLGASNSITIPDVLGTTPVVGIGNSAFAWNESLQSVTIPSSVKAIGDSAFHGCSALQNVVIPNGVESIGDSAFASCTSLQDVTIPASVEYLYEYVFYDCTSLRSISVDPGNPNYSGVDGVLFDYGKTNIILYPVAKTATSYTMPDTVEWIGNNAFSGNAYLTNLTIGKNLEDFNTYAFTGCTALKSISVSELNPYYKSEGGVLFDSGMTNLLKYPAAKEGASYAVPTSVYFIYSYAFQGCKNLTSVTLPEGLSDIFSGTFSDCAALANITFPSGLESIGSYAFKECTSLTSVTLPAGLKYIEGSAFDTCTALTAVDLPSSLLMIGDSAFGWCRALESIVIPSKVNYLGWSAFSGCQNLSSAYFLGSLPSELNTYDSNIFGECAADLTLYCPTGNTSWNGFSNPDVVSVQRFTPSYTLALNPAADKNFGSQPLGYAQPAAYTVTVKNTGSLPNGNVTVSLSGTGASAFALSKNSLGALGTGQSTTFTVQPKAGLSVGTYNATVLVSGSNNSDSFIVSFTVTASSAKDDNPGGAATQIAIGGAPAQYPWKAADKTHTAQLSATITPANATVKDVRWSVDKPAIATVSATGLLTFTGAEGVVRVTATSNGSPAVSAYKDIKVVKNVTAVSTPLKKIYIQKGKSYAVPFEIYDGAAVIKAGLTWKSSNEKTAKVSATGKVTIPKAVKKGKATITATAANGKKLSITVNVSATAVKLKKITVKAPASMKGGTTKNLTIKLAQPKATLTKVTFKSSKASGLKVDKAGKLTALKKGSYTITIKVGAVTVKKKITVK